MQILCKAKATDKKSAFIQYKLHKDQPNGMLAAMRKWLLPRLLFWKSTLKGWWSIMSTILFIWGVFGNIRSEIISAAIQEKLKLAVLFPQVQWYWLLIIFLVLTLIAVLEGAYRSHKKRVDELNAEHEKEIEGLKHDLLAKTQSITNMGDKLAEQAKQIASEGIRAQIKEAHIIPSAVGADCFVRLEVYNKSAPMRVMDYQMKLITREGEFDGDWADARGYYLVVRKGGELDRDGDPQWTVIREEPLRSVPANTLVTRTDPLTGWLRFCFEGVPKWKTWGEVVGSDYETDEYGEEHHVPVFDGFFVKTTATGITVTVIDSDGNQIEAHSKQVSCDASRTIKPLRQNGGKK